MGWETDKPNREGKNQEVTEPQLLLEVKRGELDVVEAESRASWRAVAHVMS